MGADVDEMTLAVVGLGYLNRDGSDRRFEVALCRPGDPVHLAHEPRNRHDPRAVAVTNSFGVQLGYLSAERCGYIGARIAHEKYEVAFQDVSGDVAYIRIRFGGGRMTMPPPMAPRLKPARYDDAPDHIDPEGPIWGA